MTLSDCRRIKIDAASSSDRDAVDMVNSIAIADTDPTLEKGTQDVGAGEKDTGKNAKHNLDVDPELKKESSMAREVSSASEAKAPALTAKNDTYMDGIRWHKGSKFICCRKYSEYWEKHTDKVCLVNLDDVLDANKKLRESRERGVNVTLIRVVEDVMQCQATHKWSMKVCRLKGESSDLRVSYRTKKHIPNSCFKRTEEKHVVEVSNGQRSEFGLVEAALYPFTCLAEKKNSEEAKKIWATAPEVNSTDLNKSA
eukprot:CAMPEP_0169084622 /NCGR_PEP_ID=MMETSP1015-20121227/12727_1 /TAXON_ID=342587 /ORGANISM="Karlodinium micrum, Strain CCMP2283" /LENGTH=254 /DNA_ID=CAMNT_0009144659 /DNA_START=89 /DNA_END=853 /DNA_ORIENTATION=-